MPSSSTTSPISRKRRRAAKLAKIRKQRAELLKLEEELSALKENNNRNPSYPKPNISGNLGAFKNKNADTRHAVLSPNRLYLNGGKNLEKVDGSSVECRHPHSNSLLQPSPKRFGVNTSMNENSRSSNSPKLAKHITIAEGERKQCYPNPSLANSKDTKLSVGGEALGTEKNILSNNSNSIKLVASISTGDNSVPERQFQSTSTEGKDQPSILSQVEKQLGDIDNLLLSPAKTAVKESGPATVDPGHRIFLPKAIDGKNLIPLYHLQPYRLLYEGIYRARRLLFLNNALQKTKPLPQLLDLLVNILHIKRQA